ncbi:MAG: adenosylmethionine decarboxylase [Rubrivivax sp.]|nr:adenosylmethionine decarboxylase [Rubrivivax sp.]
MQGLHLISDLRGVVPTLAVMLDTDALRQLLLLAVRDAGLHAVGEAFHRFPAPGGVTGVVLLAEWHVAVHTWPELGAVTVDVYVCNAQADNHSAAVALQAALEAAFAPCSAERQRVLRGLGAAAAATSAGV